MFDFTFSIDFGKATDWIQAIANTLILLLGILTLIDQKRQIKDLRRQNIEQKRLEEQKQASLVSVWADEWKSKHISGFCLNLNNEPIYEVEVSYKTYKKHIFMMKPNEEKPFSFSIDESIVLSDFPRIAISFRDASGRKWRRDDDGIISSMALL